LDFLQGVLSEERLPAEGGPRQGIARRSSGLEDVEPGHREDEERRGGGDGDPREPPARGGSGRGLRLFRFDSPDHPGQEARALPALPERRGGRLDLLPEPERLAALLAVEAGRLERRHRPLAARQRLLETIAAPGAHGETSRRGAVERRLWRSRRASKSRALEVPSGTPRISPISRCVKPSTAYRTKAERRRGSRSLTEASR